MEDVFCYFVVYLFNVLVRVKVPSPAWDVPDSGFIFCCVADVTYLTEYSNHYGMQT